MLVFGAVIRFFKEKLQERLERQGNEFGFSYKDVYWVITVPAIWNLKAKQFMRKAADSVSTLRLNVDNYIFSSSSFYTPDLSGRIMVWPGRLGVRLWVCPLSL